MWKKFLIVKFASGGGRNKSQKVLEKSVHFSNCHVLRQITCQKHFKSFFTKCVSKISKWRSSKNAMAFVQSPFCFFFQIFIDKKLFKFTFVVLIFKKLFKKVWAEFLAFFNFFNLSYLYKKSCSVIVHTAFCK